MRRIIFFVFTFFSLILTSALPAQAEACRAGDRKFYVQADADPTNATGLTEQDPLPSTTAVQEKLDARGETSGCVISLDDPAPRTGERVYSKSAASGVPLPTLVLYSLLALFFVLLFSGGWLLQRRGQRLEQQP